MKRGDRVKLSERGMLVLGQNRRGKRVDWKARRGVICSVHPRGTLGRMRVQWDGRATTETLHRDFIEVCQ